MTHVFFLRRVFGTAARQHCAFTCYGLSSCFAVKFQGKRWVCSFCFLRFRR